MNKTIFGAAVIGITLMMAIAAQADESIGINFTGGYATVGPSSLALGDVTGVVPQANWNNADTNIGTTTNLMDNTGALTGVGVTYTAPNTFVSYVGTANADQRLLQGYLDTAGVGSPSTVSVSGLSSLFQTYNVYVYTLGANGGRTGDYTIGGVTNFTTPTVPYSGSGFILGDTYTVFTGLTGDAFTLTSGSTKERAPVNGVQIIGLATPEPGSLALLVGMASVGVAIFRKRRNR